MDDTTAQGSYVVSELPAHTLPPDIITAIISQVDDRGTLLSLCLANHFVGREAARWLYRYLDDAPQKREYHLKRLSSLLSNPSLPPLVQSFTLIDMTRPTRHSEEALRQLIRKELDFTKRLNLVEQLLSILLEKILPRMINLKKLEYYSRRPECQTAVLLLALGERITFQLRKLRWSNSWDESFIDFIKAQKRLKTLELGAPWCLSEPIINHRIPQDICDGLTALSGDQRVVEAILPFAPGVKSVDLNIGRPKDERGIFGPEVDVQATGHLAKVMLQLTRLTLHNYTTRTPIFTFGPQALSGLRILVVDSILDEHESADTTCIAQIPNLELFVQTYCQPHSGGAVAWCRRATKLLKLSTSLKEVVMLSYDPSFKAAPRAFWFLLRRGDLLPRKLSWPEKRRRRFFMPVVEVDAADPGWVDEGSLPIPLEAHQILQG